MIRVEHCANQITLHEIQSSDADFPSSGGGSREQGAQAPISPLHVSLFDVIFLYRPKSTYNNSS
jgi:hypothetical protein